MNINTCTAASVLVSLAVIVAVVASASERRQTGQTLESANVRECNEIISRHYCSDTTFSQDGANIVLQCGSLWFSAAENFAAGCVRDNDGNYCSLLYSEEPEFNPATLATQAALCMSVINSTSTCPTECRNYLQGAVDAGGCCFRTIFTEPVSQEVFGRDVDVSLEACNVIAPPACSDSPIELTPPANTDLCSADEYWTRTVVHICDTENSQAYINAVLENPVCTPYARFQVNICGRGDVNNKFCLELFGLGANTVDLPGTNTEIYNVVNQCANYSSFGNDGCPVHCQDALQAAVDALGCCIKIFDDPEIFQPHFADEVLAACSIETPGKCESALTVPGGSVTVQAIVTWIYVCLALLYMLN